MAKQTSSTHIVRISFRIDNPLSVILQLVALVALVLTFIGIAKGASPFWVIPPLAVSVWNIFTWRSGK